MQKSSNLPISPEQLSWDDVRYFLSLARGGSLSAAARELAVEHSTVARRIGALEGAIKLRLFDRLPRGWQLTDEGKTLLDAAERIELEAHAFGRAVQGMTAMQGTVRLSAPPALSSRFLMPLMAQRYKQWEGIQLDVVGEIRAANLHRRDADLALRLSRPEDPGLMARRLGSAGYGLYGNARWKRVARNKRQFIGYGEALQGGPHQAWLAQYTDGAAYVLTANDFTILHQACRSGLGLTILPHFVARNDAELEQFDTGQPPWLRDMWLTVHPDLRRSPRVQRIADLLAEIVQEQQAFLA
ncbi:LysR family transcriptional regulator [Herbaspirillum sp. RV1423]|uniref:LysR family transcriptional regulator n=1 Tax=Herbaspirillum sp. RV1423 TaxID=1443993 RepID=UPI0004B07285|nr:LysR family transcriptional regulator [Herbaspirillum sp. RV1423]